MRLNDNLVLRHIMGDWLLVSKKDSKVFKVSSDVADVVLGKAKVDCDSENVADELYRMGILVQ